MTPETAPLQAVRVDAVVSQHFNQLTPAEAERLALLAEECGEVIQAIGKILRHGYESRHPDGGPTNREALEREHTWRQMLPRNWTRQSMRQLTAANEYDEARQD